MPELSTPQPDEEWDAYQQGTAAYDRSVPRDDNPHSRFAAPVLHARWDAGWTARAGALEDRDFTEHAFV